MSYSREFIKDRVLTHDNYYGWENAIAVIFARWKITNSQYPDGFSYHNFVKELDVNAITRDTWVPINEVTDAQLETWCTQGLTANTIAEIETHHLTQIQQQHNMAQLTEHYVNPDL